jgi:apolipoprotein N-acyltransferase
LVRSTNSGITCLITPNGRITERLDPFVEDYLIVDVPVFTGRTTLYTLWEDWFGIGALLITFAGILFGIIKKTLKEKFKKD